MIKNFNDQDISNNFPIPLLLHKSVVRKHSTSIQRILHRSLCFTFMNLDWAMVQKLFAKRKMSLSTVVPELTWFALERKWNIHLYQLFFQFHSWKLKWKFQELPTFWNIAKFKQGIWGLLFSDKYQSTGGRRITVLCRHKAAGFGLCLVNSTGMGQARALFSWFSSCWLTGENSGDSTKIHNNKIKTRLLPLLGY